MEIRRQGIILTLVRPQFCENKTSPCKTDVGLRPQLFCEYFTNLQVLNSCFGIICVKYFSVFRLTVAVSSRFLNSFCC